MQDRCEAVEDEVARVEAAIAECEQSLAVFENAEQTRHLTAMLEERRKELDKLMREWEELTDEISRYSG